MEKVSPTEILDELSIEIFDFSTKLKLYGLIYGNIELPRKSGESPKIKNQYGSVRELFMSIEEVCTDEDEWSDEDQASDIEVEADNAREVLLLLEKKGVNIFDATVAIGLLHYFKGAVEKEKERLIEERNKASIPTQSVEQSSQ